MSVPVPVLSVLSLYQPTLHRLSGPFRGTADHQSGSDQCRVLVLFTVCHKSYNAIKYTLQVHNANTYTLTNPVPTLCRILDSLPRQFYTQCVLQTKTLTLYQLCPGSHQPCINSAQALSSHQRHSAQPVRRPAQRQRAPDPPIHDLISPHSLGQTPRQIFISYASSVCPGYCKRSAA